LAKQSIFVLKQEYLSAEEFLQSLGFFYSEIAINFCCGYDAKCRLQIRLNQKLDCNALEVVLDIVTGMGAPKRNVLLIFRLGSIFLT
jgi:hypothetical protein